MLGIFQRRAAAVLLALLSLPSLAADDSSDSVGDAQVRREVQRLIEMLGDPSYATRTRARSELERMGLLAFDALHAAQLHDDSEIAMGARFLVESLHVSWSTDEDSTEVRQILDEYGTQSEVERKSRMDRLAALPDREGLAALCRLVRFETKLRLSRSAALLVMKQQPSDSEQSHRRSAAVIVESLGSNSRDAAQWLGVYASDLANNTYSQEKWRRFIDQERQRAAGLTTRSTDDNAVLQLYRICAVRAMQSGLDEESHDLAMASLDLVEGRKQPLRDATQWMLDHEMWPVLLTLHQRESEDFKNDAWLLYAAAEALSQTGNSEQSEQLVLAALELAPLPPLADDGTSPLSADAHQQAVRRHSLVASELVTRGRFTWAEREYRYVIDRSPIDSALAASARWSLSFLFGELERFNEASELLVPVVERMKKDADFRRSVAPTNRPLDELESYMHYYRGRALAVAGDDKQARETLLKARAADPMNVDILIAMYRLQGDDEWRKLVDGARRTALSKFELDIKNYQRMMNVGAPNGLDNAVSMFCNQYAWLVANTEGDYHRALTYSQRSLELRPKTASLTDTLAHCYFAIGDFDAAVRTQRQALALEPHSPSIVRQLKFFESKRQERQEQQNSGGDEG